MDFRPYELFWKKLSEIPNNFEPPNIPEGEKNTEILIQYRMPHFENFVPRGWTLIFSKYVIIIKMDVAPRNSYIK